MEENCEKNHYTRGKNEWQAWKNHGNRGNRCENEEIAGRKLWKNRRDAGKGLKKRHEMEERQGIEKARNIEASILKKLKIRSSTESSVRWASEQDGLQGDEEWCRGRSGEGLQIGQWRKIVQQPLKWRKKWTASLKKPRKIEKTVGKMRKLQEGNSWKTVGAQEKGWEKGMKWRKGKALKKLGTYRQAYWKN